MRRPIAIALAALAITACSQAAQSETPLASPPAETIAMIEAETGPDWRKIAPENLLVLKTAHGETLIELNPNFAPGHAARTEFGDLRHGCGQDESVHKIVVPY